jgi:hypothetical protein
MPHSFIKETDHYSPPPNVQIYDYHQFWFIYNVYACLFPHLNTKLLCCRFLFFYKWCVEVNHTKMYFSHTAAGRNGLIGPKYLAIKG